jgi:cell division protein YceG involved in septum cleavage
MQLQENTAQDTPSLLGEDEALPWQQALGKTFKRVVCFKVKGGEAWVEYTYGVLSSQVCQCVSLAEPSPLRWAIEAGGAMLGSGFEPNNARFLESLGIAVPRAFAVLPRIENQTLTYLVYVDAGYEPLSIIPVLEAWNQGVHDTPAAFDTLPSFSTPQEHIQEPPPVVSHRIQKSVLLTACAALLCFALGWLGWVVGAPPSVSANKPVSSHYLLTVKNPEDLAQSLYQEKRIQHPSWFLWLWKWTGLSDVPAAGFYRMPQGLWLWDVVGALKKTAIPSYNIAVLPGMTGADIGQLFVSAGHVSSVAWLQATHSATLLNAYSIPSQSVEGYLLPGTYWFTRGMKAEDIVRAMLQRFYESIASINGMAQLSPSELHDRVYIAAAVEKESRTTEEMRRFAGLVQNRLRKRLTLISKTELQSPSMEALRASMDPEDHNYLYSIPRTDGSGLHIFLSTRLEYEKTLRLLEAAKSP